MSDVVMVGDVWKFGGVQETVYGVDGDDIVTCKAGTVDAIDDGFRHFGVGCCYRKRFTLSEGRLISRAAPPETHPAREAESCETAKAVPRCTNGRDCPTPTAPVFVRVLRDERQPMCDGCYVAHEAAVELQMAFDSPTGVPCAQPPGLLNRKLSHSYQVEDPALEDA